MALAEVFNLASGTDKTVIPNVRVGVIQPFDAPDWLDLRVGFLVSITKPLDEDDTTDLDETIVAPGGGLGPEDRHWIGVKDRGSIMPDTSGSVFAGYTNRGLGPHGPVTRGNSVLVSSDEGIGTTNADFWRSSVNYIGREYPNLAGAITDGIFVRAFSADGIQQHFVQDAMGPGGYATLLMLRLQRDNTMNRGKIITVTTKAGTHNGDVLYTGAPTKALLQASLESFPDTVQQWGPVTLTSVPDALFLYWPYHDSRLRIHAMGILKAR